jgi:hypothetical protein
MVQDTELHPEAGEDQALQLSAQNIGERPMARAKTTKPVQIKPSVTIVNDDTPTEVLASAIVDISRAAKSLLSSRLRHDTLIMLISHSAKVPQKHVKAVLDSLTDLERRYLK